MKRKIIKQGTATLTLSLPAKWTKQLNLKAGDEIDIEQSNSQLVLSSEKTVEKAREITIDITEENKQDTRNILTHLYRQGFDTITLKGITPSLMAIIENVTKELLLGFEITERGAKQCKITNISEPTQEKYDVLLRRTFLIIKETQNIIQKDFEKSTYPNIKEIENLLNQHDKFILFCRRILFKRRYEGNPMIMWELLTFLMHIQHAYYYLYKYSQENKIKVNKNIIDLLRNLQNYFNLFYDSFYKKDVKFIHRINKQKNEFQFGKCYKYLQHSKGKDAILFAHIRELFRLIQIGTSPILNHLLEDQYLA